MILRTQPPAPESFGLNPQTTEIEVLTEFINPPAAKVGEHKMKGRLKNNSLPDDEVDWGVMRIGHGRAFDLGETRNSHSRVTVRRQYMTANGRNILVEGVSMQSIQANLANLPLQASSKSRLRMLASKTLALPKTPLAQAKPKPMQLASASPSSKGYVLDYVLLDTDPGDFTFQADTTYYIANGIDFNGNLTFEGGTVIKYNTDPDNPGCMECWGDITCATTPYRPAIFTSQNDDTVGESISDPDKPLMYYWCAMCGNSSSSTEWHDLCVRYAHYGIVGNSEMHVSDSQFVQCEYPFFVYWGPTYYTNILLENVGTPFYGNDFQATIYNMTIDGCANNQLVEDFWGEDASTVSFINSLLVNAGSDGAATITTDHTARVTDSGGQIFQSGNAGDCYLLPDSPFIDAGNTTADREGLYWWTTQTNQAIDGVTPVDLGYHYPAVDANGNPIDTDGDGIPDYLEDPNGYGLPEWWETNNFGSYSYFASTLDPLGNTLLYDYTNGVDFTAPVQFTVRLGNQQFNTTSATGNYMVISGVPYYEAVLVNDTNLNDAVWTNYDGNITMNLGPTDGVYQVWFGLAGLTTNTQPTWMGTDVTLNRSKPQIFITNPTTNVVATPYIQVQGCSAMPLASVTFDISNAVSFATNQLGSIIGHTVDTNTLSYTTDYFQCFDIPLTNGMNAITLHCADPAGNVTLTNVNITLDYTTASNPVINLYWPQNNTVIVGTNFTLRGWTEDASAQAFAQIVDTNGDTNVVTGIVGRDGKIWAQNLSLASGTNYLTLTVTNSAGLSSTTNIVVVKSALNMTMNPVTGDLRLPTTAVSGTISDPADYTVWVNGVKATVTGNNWEADNVPLPAGGGVTAIQVRAIPNADNGGSGTGVGGGGSVTFDNLGNPGQDDDMEPGALPRQTGVVVDSAVWGYNTVWYYPLTASYELTQEDGLYEPTQEEDHVTGNYSFAKGGKVTEDWIASYIDGTDDTKTVWVLAPGGAVTNCNGMTVTNGSLPAGVGYGLENGKLSGKYWPNPDCIITQDKSSNVKMTFYVGGFGVLGQQVLVAVNPPSQAQQEVTQPGFASGGPEIPYEQTSIPGLGKNLGTDGWAYGQTTIGGDPIDVTPTAGAPMYNFPWPNVTAYALSIQANNIDLTESAVLGLVPKFCVGQKVKFSPSWDVGPPNVASNSYSWALAGTFVNRDTTGIGRASDTWDIDPDSLNSDRPVGYWTTGGMKFAYLHETLYFSNGQSATVYAGGGFNMFRPSVTFPYTTPIPPMVPMITNGWLELGNDADPHFYGQMQFDALVTSEAPFCGSGYTVNWVQLINRSASFDSTDGFEYDSMWSNGVWFGGTNNSHYLVAPGLVNNPGLQIIHHE